MEPELSLDTASIVAEVLKGYPLPVRGTHGVVHWARVLENGLRLAELTGANPAVVTLFALFHDSRRTNEGHDPGHGHRGAKLAHALRGTFVHLEDAAFEQLFDACRYHTERDFSRDVTIQACWDADRLDLGRGWIVPDPKRLGSEAARSLIPWAHERARAGVEPDILAGGWGL
jgi:uncharacterized protein